MFGLTIVTIGGLAWVGYHMRMEQKTPHNSKLDKVIETTQMLIMIACVLFVLFAVGHYNPLGVSGNNDCISAEQGAC